MSAQWHPCPRPRQWHGFVAQGSREILQTLGRVVQAVAGDERPELLCVCADGDAFVVLDGHGVALSPVLFGQGLTLPASAVPGDFSQPRLGAAYRRSPLRQVRFRAPDLALAAQGLVSMGAWLHRALGVPRWCDVTPVLGAPFSARGEGAYARDDALWLALGCGQEAVSALASPGEVIGALDSEVAREWGMAGGVPLMVTADVRGAQAYGLAANPVGWAIALGRGVSADWVGPRVAPDRMTVAIIEDRAGAGVEDEADGAAGRAGVASDEVDAPEEVRSLSEPDLATLARVVWAGLAHRVAVRPGLRPGRSVFGLGAEVGPTLWSEMARDDGWGQLAQAPLGAEGVRVLPGANGATVLGLREGHGVSHLLRAVFEGALFEVRRWRSVNGLAGAERPRVVLASPWLGVDGAMVADLLGEPVLMWDEAPWLPALMGCALAGARCAGFMGDKEGPRFQLTLCEPTERAGHYARHFGVHCALADVLEGAIA